MCNLVFVILHKNSLYTENGTQSQLGSFGGEKREDCGDNDSRRGSSLLQLHLLEFFMKCLLLVGVKPMKMNLNVQLVLLN